MTRLRIVPPSAAQLAAAADAPHLVYIAAEHTQRNALAIATSRIGLGLDLSADVVRITASRAALEQLAAVLGGSDDALAADLARYLSPIAAWELRTGPLEMSRAHVMGIVNLTTDSFSGDGVGADVTAALRRAEALRNAGASIIDLGAESARADRPIADAHDEAGLVSEAVRALTREGHRVSADTYKPGVARAALESGAEVINDISGLTLGMGAAQAAIDAGAGYILNYSYSVPKRRPDAPPVYDDVAAETVAWMAGRVDALASAGMARESLAIDPGIAFGKSHDEDIQILRRVGELTTFGLPVLLAHSRKNFIGSINGQPPTGRDIETHVLSAMAYAQGVRIFRVHDVEGARRALEMAAALASAGRGAFAPDDGSWPWRAGAAASHMVSGEARSPAPEGQRW
jgi:dihydropteroate synthase